MNIICVIYFLIQYVQNTIISMCNQNNITMRFFECWVFEAQCEICTYSTSQLGLAMTQVLSSHMWLVVAALATQSRRFHQVNSLVVWLYSGRRKKGILWNVCSCAENWTLVLEKENIDRIFWKISLKIWILYLYRSNAALQQCWLCLEGGPH